MLSGHNGVEQPASQVEALKSPFSECLPVERAICSIFRYERLHKSCLPFGVAVRSAARTALKMAAKP